MRIITWVQLRPSMTWGNQKWKGAAPSLRRRAKEINESETIGIKNVKVEDKMMMADPRAWIKKYFREASDGS